MKAVRLFNNNLPIDSARTSAVSGIMMTKMEIVNVKFHNYQIVANSPLNAIEIVRFLKTNEIWVFFEKIHGFLRKKIEFHQNR